MESSNDSSSSPLQFFPKNGWTIGQFYNSWDKTYHLAKYIPYKSPPNGFLCNAISGRLFASSKNTDKDRKICKECFRKLEELDNIEG